jgi:hypothetical protein
MYCYFAFSDPLRIDDAAVMAPQREIRKWIALCKQFCNLMYHAAILDESGLGRNRASGRAMRQRIHGKFVGK